MGVIGADDYTAEYRKVTVPGPDPEVVADTAGILFKQREDVTALTREMAVELLKPEEVS